MQQERTDNMKEISSLAEKLGEREVTIDRLNEQLQLPTNPNLLEPQIPTSPLAASPDLQQPPEVQTYLSLLYKHPAEQLLTPIKQHTSDIIALMDSNGKFLDDKRLFPNHSVTKIWCATTNRALDLLSEEHLGSRSHIIIHTGTNDLRTKQERGATLLRAVINKASNTFPNTKIVMSTLLPWKDFHPKTILGISAIVPSDPMYTWPITQPSTWSTSTTTYTLKKKTFLPLQDHWKTLHWAVSPHRTTKTTEEKTEHRQHHAGHRDQHTVDKKGELHNTDTHITALLSTQDMAQLESPQSTAKELVNIFPHFCLRMLLSEQYSISMQPYVINKFFYFISYFFIF